MDVLHVGTCESRSLRACEKREGERERGNGLDLVLAVLAVRRPTSASLPLAPYRLGGQIGAVWYARTKLNTLRDVYRHWFKQIHVSSAHYVTHANANFSMIS